MALGVSVILDRKGFEVITVGPSATLASAAEVMSRHDVGALVVSTDGQSLDGIISERDLVRCVARDGPSCLQRSVDQLMTTDVATCTRETSLEELMATMTQRRIRHMPVVDGSALTGMISIGDVVKSRLDELEVENEALEQYVTGSG